MPIYEYIYMCIYLGIYLNIHNYYHVNTYIIIIIYMSFFCLQYILDIFEYTTYKYYIYIYIYICINIYKYIFYSKIMEIFVKIFIYYAIIL